MSRRERRDSDSRRRHSRFDREPSPRRTKRNERQERERDRRERDKVISSVNHENGIGNLTDRDQKHRHELHVALPPEAPSARDPKQEARAGNKDTDKKPKVYNGAPKRPSNPTEVPRSSSYFQHDERSSTGHVRRGSGRMATERGWWKDLREQLIEKETSHRREQRDEKSRAKPDDHTSLRKDALSERIYDPPPTTKKRPAFRERKIPADHEHAKPVATETAKSNQTDHPLERNERREEKRYNPRHLDRPDKQQYAGDRAPNKNEARRDVFLSRGRYNGNYGGRDRFHGREDFHFSKTGVDKWKHDLYQEASKDPVPKNEDDQIAKLEALLAS
ncbi:uncharacterized protein DDB_G0283697 isoform X2 [Neltuma alba]|uniref:uncharacterized protein DDB_G0283697 isoform X2 n=1 Tax=Neltuma alba TaxID=207710 RepID=UPI0010A3C485|nr:uncharacterized protein DDB_G0283697-like isoform X2 [Prosopis alba]